MIKKLERPCVLLLALSAINSVNAADVRFNGFASLAGGITLNEGTQRNFDGTDGVDSPSTYLADRITVGVYDDDISFRPDTSYGLQVTADAGHGLTVVGQITGNGGEAFDANVAWAYVAYDFSESFRLTAGRQRLPFFFYSDFFDVAYAYHWIRPPQELAASDFDTFEGVKLRWTPITGDVEWGIELFGGGASEVLESGSGVEFENQWGLSVTATYDWLTLRAHYSEADLIIDNDALTGITGQGTDDDPIPGNLIGLAAKADFGNVFFVSEFTAAPLEDPVYPELGLNGVDGTTGWYISAGFRIGEFTPHITYSQEDIDYVETSVTGVDVVDGIPVAQFGNPVEYESQREAWTVGVRWDFHPSAAFKLEYLTRSDKSDDYFQNGVGTPSGRANPGRGDSGEVDLLSFAIDVLF